MKSEIRTEQITVRISPRLRTALDGEADKTQRSIADIVGFALDVRYGRPSSDAAEAETEAKKSERRPMTAKQRQAKNKRDRDRRAAASKPRKAVKKAAKKPAKKAAK